MEESRWCQNDIEITGIVFAFFIMANKKTRRQQMDKCFVLYHEGNNEDVKKCMEMHKQFTSFLQQHRNNPYLFDAVRCGYVWFLAELILRKEEPFEEIQKFLEEETKWLNNALSLRLSILRVERFSNTSQSISTLR